MRDRYIHMHVDKLNMFIITNKTTSQNLINEPTPQNLINDLITKTEYISYTFVKILKQQRPSE